MHAGTAAASVEVCEVLLVFGGDVGRGALRALRVPVEHRRVVRGPHLRDEGGGNVAVLQRLPVHALVPLVLLDVLRAVLEAAETLGAVVRQQALDEVLGLDVEVPREVDAAREHLLVDAEGVLVVEGRVARQHLEDEDAQGPPVHGAAVALGLDDLRRQVLGCAAESPGAVLDLLGEAEVRDLHVALAVDEQILGLQVAVDDVLGVQVGEGQDDLPCVELGVRVGQPALPAEVGEQLAPVHKLQEQEEALVVLETREQVNHEGVLDPR
mmetsp:Transcript_77581/g.240356  ORF Transcript_77581/g.240356 Transcript_77581/m.240356 type:complete len:268 (+) Transcript_77581:2-805(+)